MCECACVYVCVCLYSVRAFFLVCVLVRVHSSHGAIQLATQALYNLGLSHRLLDNLDAAREAFEKFLSSVPGSTDGRLVDAIKVIYVRVLAMILLTDSLTYIRRFQLSCILDDMSKAQEAMRKLKHIIDELPSDPSVHCRYSILLARDEEESEAFHFQSEAYRCVCVCVVCCCCCCV